MNYFRLRDRLKGRLIETFHQFARQEKLPDLNVGNLHSHGGPSMDEHLDILLMLGFNQYPDLGEVALAEPSPYPILRIVS